MHELSVELDQRLPSLLQWSTLEFADSSGDTSVHSDARSLGLPDAERLAIVTWIAANPAVGKVIGGTGGARKVRFAGKGRGKTGGYGS